MPSSLTDRAPEVAMKTAGGAAARSAPQAARRLSCIIHSWARTREDPFCGAALGWSSPTADAPPILPDACHAVSYRTLSNAVLTYPGP